MTLLNKMLLVTLNQQDKDLSKVLADTIGKAENIKLSTPKQTDIAKSFK